MPEPSFPPPVLILTPPGLPGQTLAAALGRNPAGYDLPELFLEQAASVDQLQRDMVGVRGMQMLGLMRAVAQLYGGEQTGLAVEMARRWLNARAHLPTAHVTGEIAARIAPRRMIVPVTGALFDGIHLKQLLRNHPGAICIQLTVHPFTYGGLVSQSQTGEIMLKLAGAVDETVEPALPDPQHLWRLAHTAFAKVAGQIPPDRILRQDLEDLVTDPGAALAALARALDMPGDAGAVALMRDPEASVFAGPGPLGAPIAGNIHGFDSLARDVRAARSGAGLDDRLPWRPDGVGLEPEIRDIARALGYR